MPTFQPNSARFAASWKTLRHRCKVFMITNFEHQRHSNFRVILYVTMKKPIACNIKTSFITSIHMNAPKFKHIF